MSCRIIPRMLAAAWLASIMAVAASGQTHDADEKKGWLGVCTTSTIAQTVQHFNLTLDSGAVVEYVLAGGPAEKHGIHEGDVIVKVDEQDISTPSEFGNALYGKKPGNELLLEIIRDGTRQQVRVVMGERPSDAEFARLWRDAAEKGHAQAQAQLGRAYMLGEGVDKDYTQAIEWLRRSANQGTPTGQFLLGVMYDEGYGVEQSYSEALKWYIKAADQANAASQNNIGIICKHGRGVQQDEATAVGWFRAAAEQGHAGAQCNLASMYTRGRGVKRDYEEALKWYRQAADQNDARGQNNVGWAYEYGRGVEQNYKEAVKWYGLAAEQGYALGQCNLADMYESGRGVEQDYAEALKWYRRAAEAGDARGQANVGWAYEFGKGVDQDFVEAVKWYRKGAEQDYAWAQYNLADMYEDGKGVEKNYATAVEWYRAAAEQGYAKGQFKLGSMYEDGKGVQQNFRLAAEWYTRAAENGHVMAAYGLGLFYRWGHGVEQDYVAAMKWYRKAAEQGNASCQCGVASMYEDGLGVVQDYGEALKWYRKAADQGSARGQINIGFAYEFGRGVEKDYKAAAEWYRKAAEQGNSLGQYYLADLYEDGHGVDQDYAAARQWFRKAADQGDEDAQNRLGEYYEFGHGVKIDYAKALEWYRRAAVGGSEWGQFHLAVMYEKGKGIEKNTTEAIKWFTKAAEQGHKQAQVNLGMMYEDGDGVERNYAEAMSWYRKAAEQGYAKAQNNLGEMYQYGKGVERDYTTALQWYRKAAEQDHAWAQYHLGVMHEEGQGVEKDPVAAVAWYRKAAEQDHQHAQHLLARCCEQGRGTARDYVAAAKWYRKAAEQGQQESQYFLGRLFEFGIGCSADMREATRWYRKAAEQGHALAREIVGSLKTPATTEMHDIAGDIVTGRVNPESCTLEVLLPASANLAIDGRDHGTKRTLLYRSLAPGKIYESTVEARFADGQTVRRYVAVQRGQHLALPIRHPGTDRPELVAQTGHTVRVHSAAFSPDGRYVLTGSPPGPAILWDVATGRQLRTYAGGKMYLGDVGFTAQGTRVVTNSEDHSTGNDVTIWDRDSGRRLKAVWPDVSHCAVIHLDGETVLVGGNRGRVTMWNMESGQRLRVLDNLHTDYVHSVAFNPDGSRMLTGSKDRTVILWDASNGQQIRKFGPHRYPVNSVTFSPDGARIAAACGTYVKDDATKGQLVVWDVERGTRVSATDHAKRLSEIAYSPSGDFLLVNAGTKEGQVRNRDVMLLRGDTLTPVWSRRTAETAETCTFSPDGKFVFDGVVLRDVKNGTEIRRFISRQDRILQATFSSDGRRLLVEFNHKWALLDLDSGKEASRFTFGEDDAIVHRAKLTTDNQQVIFIAEHRRSKSAELVTFQVDGSKVLNRFPISAGSGSELSITRHGQLALVNFQKVARLWDVRSGNVLRTFGNQNHLVWRSTISSDGQNVLTEPVYPAERNTDGSYRFNLATLWQTKTGRALRSYSNSSSSRDFVGFRGFGPNDRTVVTAGHERQTGIVRLWDKNTGNLLKTLRGHSVGVMGVRHFAMTPDARYGVSHSDDYSTIVWDVQSGTRVFSTSAHTALMSAPSLSPDGRWLATIANEDFIRIWDVATGSEVCKLICHGAEAGWLVTTPEGLFDGSATARQNVAYRVGDGLNVVPVERFFQEFYRPGLLAEVWMRERPLPEVELGHSQPPRIRIVSPMSGTVESHEVTIDVQVTDQGGGISGLAIYQNDARVLAPGQTRRDGDTLHRNFQIALVEGRNRLRVKASSGDGSWEAEPAEIVLNYEVPLDKSELHVVAIGASRYADANLNLNYAAHDAQSVAELFQSRGDALYARVHVTEVIDDQATKKGIKGALKKIAAETRPQDTLVVFLAGHGTMVGQRYYFVPHELRKQADRLEDDIRKQGLPADEISDYLGTAKALKRLLILDTCSSGGALSSALRSRSGFALRGAIERLSRTQGVFTIAAAAATEEAQESKELGHGVLSYALLAGLKAVDGGPLEGRYVQPSNPERVVDVMEWFGFAAGQVPRLTEKLYGASQDVQMSTQGTSFPVLPLDE